MTSTFNKKKETIIILDLIVIPVFISMDLLLLQAFFLRNALVELAMHLAIVVCTWHYVTDLKSRWSQLSPAWKFFWVAAPALIYLWLGYLWLDNSNLIHPMPF